MGPNKHSIVVQPSVSKICRNYLQRLCLDVVLVVNDKTAIQLADTVLHTSRNYVTAINVKRMVILVFRCNCFR